MVGFDKLIQLIQYKYEKWTGEKNGWRFLYSKRERLENYNGICLLTTNPGLGSHTYNDPDICYDAPDGISFLHVARHGNNVGEDKFQKQIKFLFKDYIKEYFNNQSEEDLMENMLCGSFVPFRSSGWSKIGNASIKRDLLDFGKSLWGKVFSSIKTPRLIVAINSEAYNSLRDMLIENKFRVAKQSIIRNIKWEGQNLCCSFFEKDGNKVSLIKLLYPGRFAIYDKARYSDDLKFIFEQAMN